MGNGVVPPPDFEGLPNAQELPTKIAQATTYIPPPSFGPQVHQNLKALSVRL
jgi:hypothetical protein